ncbi:NAD(P)-binding domain-containing protein [Pseudonocardia aurantiaca]|uniref:NAD(P)-dependent oxidoreductase n=1 Tax=Pseudonocardia aurantiaca TaxID=75290 RepID=A0ABW4G1H0_9PSEU
MTDKTVSAKEPVTMIGLGPMGQAMVRRFLAAGHPTTVWNRTPSRADGVISEGAVRATTPAEAVAAGGPVLLSLTDYAAMYDILGDVGDALAGRDIVNLSSESPEKTRDAADWLAERGARLLVGGVMANAPMVGADGAYALFSGPRELFDAHEPLLALIGRPDYLGKDVQLAQLYYQAQLDYFLTALAALLHSIVLVGTAGVSAKDFLPYAADTVGSIAFYLEETAREVDERHYPGDDANTAMMGATADHIVAASRAAGIDTALPEAVKALYDRAIAAGRGKESWTVLSEVMRRRLP